jgi:hypothetical protein
MSRIPKKITKELIKFGYTDWSLGNGEVFDTIYYDDVFKWFREVFKMTYAISYHNVAIIYLYIGYDLVIDCTIEDAKTYEEAELACFKIMFEILKLHRKGIPLNYDDADYAREKLKFKKKLTLYQNI